MVLTAVFSDVHGGLEGLVALMYHFKIIGVKRIVCLGDLVGEGPDPKKCVEIAMNYFDITLLGNHDQYHLQGYVPEQARGSRKSHTWIIQNWFSAEELKKELDQLEEENKERKHKISLLDKINELYRKNPPKDEKELERYKHLFKLVESEPYFRFLQSLKPELPIADDSGSHNHGLGDNIILSHGFPVYFLKDKVEGEIKKDKVEGEINYECYIVTGEQKKEKRRRREKRLGEEGKNTEQVRKGVEVDQGKYITAEKIINILPPDTTLFVGHSHLNFILEGENNRRIVNPGCVFSRTGDEVATFAIYEKDDASDVNISGVKYNRRKTEDKMRAFDLV